MEQLNGRGDVVGIENFFTSITLLWYLTKLGTYNIKTVRSNRMGLPYAIKNDKLP